MIELILAYLILVIFFLLESFIRKGATAQSISKTKSDNKSTYFIGLTFFILLFISIIFNLLKFGVFNNRKIALVGLLTMILGLIIRIYSMLTLNKYYTRTLTLAEEQTLVTKGLYKLIRHPGYLGTILIWCASGLAMQNIIIFITATVLTSIAYYYRIDNEEKMLVEKFGPQYVNYIKHSWRLIPLIW